jgi:nucleolar GTP-binding protein
MEVQLRLLDEVKAMISVPVVVVANKSDLVAPEGYLTMSTVDGSGIDAVLAEIQKCKPEPVVKARVVDIRSALPQEPDEPDTFVAEGMLGEEPKRRRVRRKPRKPRTKPGE